jgi:hypothetical protein
MTILYTLYVFFVEKPDIRFYQRENKRLSQENDDKRRVVIARVQRERLAGVYN